LPEKHENKSNDYAAAEEYEEDVRESSSNVRPSNITAGMNSSSNDLPFNNGNLIVERNDRFIIFKMVVINRILN
jgi:hypothetical protein